MSDRYIEPESGRESETPTAEGEDEDSGAGADVSPDGAGHVTPFVHQVANRSPLLAAYFKTIADRTPEAEADEFNPSDLPFTASFDSVLSRLPVVGSWFENTQDITWIMALCIHFGVMLEREYPHNRDNLEEAGQALDCMGHYMNHDESIETGEAIRPVHPHDLSHRVEKPKSGYDSEEEYLAALDEELRKNLQQFEHSEDGED